MKIGLAVAPEKASPLAFVVFRGRLVNVLEKVAGFGYQGIELALASSEEIDIKELRDLLVRFKLELPVISTGRVFAECKVSLSHPEEEIRNRAIEIMKSLIDVASEFRSKVNIGRIRGIVDGEERELVERRFINTVAQLLEYAKNKEVELIIEPVNRYETDFINTVEEGLEIIEEFNRLGFSNLGLMPDLFHMNIEEKSIEESLKLAGNKISYIHFADSNRYAPGNGHLDFISIINTLKEIGYDGYITLEILPKPEPEIAASKGIEFIRNIIRSQ